MNKYFFLMITTVLVLFLSSCDQKSETKQRAEKVSHNQTKNTSLFHVDIDYAKGFTVESHNNYQRLIVHNPWGKNSNLGVYILADAKYADSINLKEGERLIRLPINKVAIMSASNIGYFDLLNSLDKIAALGDGQRLYNKNLRQRIELGSLKVLGNSSSINTEELIVCNCDVFLQTAFDSKNARDEALVNAGVPLVYNIDWMEKTPLARAEWIKFVGVLLNENERADSIFKVIERNYINLKKIADSIDYKPDVLVGGLYKDVWYMPGGQSFKARLLADAGTDYLWKNDSTEGSLALSFETVLEKQMNAPIWIEVQFKSKKELLSSDERYAYLDAFKIGAMYHNRKRTTETGGNDYWEMGLCRPDEILSDLIRIIHREYMPDGELKYYERVK
jgi:iron complex transport system substrate-binding protein